MDLAMVTHRHVQSNTVDDGPLGRVRFDGGVRGLNPLAHNANPPSLLEISTPWGRIIQAFNPPRLVFSTHFDQQISILKDCLRVVKDLSLYFQRDSANIVDFSNNIELAV